MKKDFKLGYEIDSLISAIEKEMNKDEELKLKKRLEECEELAEKQFGSISQCLEECLNG